MVDWHPVLDLPDTTGLTVAVDTETSGLHPDDRLPEGGCCRTAAVTLAWYDDRLQTRAYPFDQGIRDKIPTAQHSLFESDPNLGFDEWTDLLEWLARQRLVFHNAKFDLQMLDAGTRHWTGRDLSGQFCWDTMVAQRQLDPLHSVGLKETAVRLLDPNAQVLADRIKTAVNALPKGTKRTGGHSSYDLVDWEDMREYAAYDAELTIRLYLLQWERIDAGEANYPAIKEEMDLCRALFRMEQRGVAYDAEASRAIAQKLQKRADQLRADLPFTPTPAGAAKYYFTDLGYPPYGMTDTGRPSVDDEVQRKMVADKLPHAAEFAEYTDLTKAISMWYQGYADKTGPDGRLRTNYKQTFVRSGRMSVERVQLQAIPKDDKRLEGVPPVRTLICAAPGYQLWNLDLGQAELRVATKYAKCELMGRMLAEGADLHGITTNEIFDAYPGPGHDYKACHCAECDEFNVKRDIAKRLTFGGIFQIGPKKFQTTLATLASIELTLSECESIVGRWRAMYPEFGRAMRNSERFVREYGYVNLCGGRYRSYFGERDYPHTAWNRIVQGSLAQFNKLWLIATDRRLTPDEGHVVLNVHDSLVLELRSHAAQRVAEREAAVAAGFASKLFQTPMTCDVKTWGTDSEKQSDEDAFQGAL